MTIITSLSPGHTNKDNQQAAVNSWQCFGNWIFSLNSPNEITDKYNGIDIRETNRTIQQYTGKPLVSINAMIELCEDDLLLINSDIELQSLPELKQDGITILSRYDYKVSTDSATMFKNGFDVFYIPKHLLSIFPPSVYAMGAAWWDYWIPYTAIYKGIPLYYPKTIHAFHKEHPTQYSIKEWEKMGEFFRWQFEFNKRVPIGEIASLALKTIKQKAI